MSQPVAPSKGTNWTPYLIAFVVLAAVVNLFLFASKHAPPSIVEQLANAPAPASAELAVQDAPDNYGVELFLILRDAEGKEMSGVGRASVTAFEGTSAEGGPVWSEDYQLVPASFTKGTRGQGPFQQDVYFARLGGVQTQQLYGKTGQYMTFRVIFTPVKGEEVAAKESHSLP